MPVRVLRLLVRAMTVSAAVMPVAACSLLLDWSHYTGADGGTGGPGGDAMTGGITCGADQRCASAPPDGWGGPLAVYEGPAGSSVPPCAMGYASTPAFDGNRGMLASPAACSACNCAAPQGSMCTPATLTFFSDGNCATACAVPQPLTASACVNPPSCGTSFNIDSPMLTGAATCTPSGGNPALPPIIWSDVVRACTPESVPARGACSIDQLCVPTPASPFPPRFCVMRIGEATACPGQAYIVGPYVYNGSQVADSRGCTQCTCQSPTGASCSFPPLPPPVFRYVDSACNAPMRPFSIPSGCQSLSGSNPFKVTSAPALAPGTCQPLGGAPTGGATPTAPVTFCCTP
jgi:hypothetical protein